MKKRWFLVGMILLLLSWLLAGCGVAQEQYDSVVAQLGSTQQSLQSVETELTAAQAENSELTSNLEESQTELEATKTENSELTSSLEKGQTELEVAKGELAAAQAENSELTSGLEKSQTELAGIKTENEDLEQANTKLKRLTFWVTALCSEKPEPEKYKAKPDNTFRTNETVYVYGRVTGFKHNLVDHELQVHIGFSIRIVNAEGKVVESRSWVDSETVERPWAFYWYYRSFQRLEEGRYTAEVEVTDHNSGETVTWKEEFQVGATGSI